MSKYTGQLLILGKSDSIIDSPISVVPEKTGTLQDMDDFTGNGFQIQIDIDGKAIGYLDVLKVRHALISQSMLINNTIAMNGDVYFGLYGKVKVVETVPGPPVEL